MDAMDAGRSLKRGLFLKKIQVSIKKEIGKTSQVNKNGNRSVVWWTLFK
jgi:hypothetical protein